MKVVVLCEETEPRPKPTVENALCRENRAPWKVW
jgi:hypothetical protein